MSTTDKSVVKKVSSIKILPAQLARLKKEEEEETWISGEELYTEGSSDEESCRYKSTTSVNSTTTAESTTKSHHQHNRSNKCKTEKKKKTVSSLLHDDDDDNNTLSDTHSVGMTTSSDVTQGPRSLISSVSDEDEEYRADDEISWKANRENFDIQDEMVALEEHQREYPKICDTIDRAFESYFEILHNSERIESEHFARKNERLQEEIKSSLLFVDTVINELEEKIQMIKKTTEHIQIRHRMRLQKLIDEGPPESKKLAENSKQFFELCTK